MKALLLGSRNKSLLLWCLLVWCLSAVVHGQDNETLTDDDVPTIENDSNTTIEAEDSSSNSSSFSGASCADQEWEKATTPDACAFAFADQCTLWQEVCQGSNCYDCDPAHEFDLMCDECIANDYYWCPRDAKCSSRVIEASLYDMYGMVSSCTTAQDWVQTCETTPNPNNFFSDPFYEVMEWQYDIINVKEVWAKNITGKGVHVRVNDDAVDPNHTEFEGKFDAEHSCEIYEPVLSESGDGTYIDGDHGTCCASLILANGNNNECSVGVAPDATLSACSLVGSARDPAVTNAEIFETHWEVVDISSNSWGPTPCTPLPVLGRRLQEGNTACPFNPDAQASPCNNLDCLNGDSSFNISACVAPIWFYCSLLRNFDLDPEACTDALDSYINPCRFVPLTADTEQAFRKLVTEGRNGSGTIIVFASGNENSEGVDNNMNGETKSRYVITVAAVGKGGRIASYSNGGENTLVSAPGGDKYDIRVNVVAKPGGGCHDMKYGTSFATPVVSGVIALMLQANPKLGWRDVQAILAQTSRKVDEKDESWAENGAGLSYSRRYGFGVIDAGAAVNASIGWTNLPEEEFINLDSGEVMKEIFNDASKVTESTLTVEDQSKSFVVESVVVYANVKHSSRGDLRVELQSPAGTVALLNPSKRPEYNEDELWRFMSKRFWNEMAKGAWTLRITDEEPQEVAGCRDYPFSIPAVEIQEFFIQEQTEGESIQQTEGDDDDGTLEGQNFTCFELEAYSDACSFGQVNETSDQIELIEKPGANNSTAKSACCWCGGGEKWDVDVLVGWKLVLYGHYSDPLAIPSTDSNVVSGNNETTNPASTGTQAPASANTTESSAAVKGTQMLAYYLAALLSFVGAVWFLF